MFTDEEHIDNLVRHIELVQAAGKLMAKRLMKQGRKDFAQLLLARVYQHDVSKFYGIEWSFLHVGPGVDKEMLKYAVEQHQATNSHHPEYHGGMEFMNEHDVAEMVCDWYARAQEFGTDLRKWIAESAIDRYKISIHSHVYEWIKQYVDMLLQSSFSS